MKQIRKCRPLSRCRKIKSRKDLNRTVLDLTFFDGNKTIGLPPTPDGHTNLLPQLIRLNQQKQYLLTRICRKGIYTCFNIWPWFVIRRFHCPYTGPLLAYSSVVINQVYVFWGFILILTVDPVMNYNDIFSIALIWHKTESIPTEYLANNTVVIEYCILICKAKNLYDSFCYVPSHFRT